MTGNKLLRMTPSIPTRGSRTIQQTIVQLGLGIAVQLGRIVYFSDPPKIFTIQITLVLSSLAIIACGRSRDFKYKRIIYTDV